MHSAHRPLLALVVACAIPGGTALAQAPPVEMHLEHVVNVGPVPVPAPCGCITNPFTLPIIRAGEEHASGPAGAQPRPAPSAADLHRQALRDAEDLAQLPSVAASGLAGDGSASMWVAWLLTTGTALQRDDEQIARWLHLAAREGRADGALQLGHRYHLGLGVPQSDQAAAYWFHRSAAAGDRGAMIATGLLYAAGRGVEQDWSIAVQWFERAAAHRFLCDAYACGLGVPQDHQRALAMYQTAQPDDVRSKVQLGHMYLNDCAPGGEKAAFEAYESAAKHGDAEAQVALSELYREGRGVPQDPYNGYFWARLAELHTPPGPLRAQASASAAKAARLLSDFLIEDADAFAHSVVQSGRR
jgi:TPR repeat protein